MKRFIIIVLTFSISACFTFSQGNKFIKQVGKEIGGRNKENEKLDSLKIKAPATYPINESPVNPVKGKTGESDDLDSGSSSKTSLPPSERKSENKSGKDENKSGKDESDENSQQNNRGGASTDNKKDKDSLTGKDKRNNIKDKDSKEDDEIEKEKEKEVADEISIPKDNKDDTGEEIPEDEDSSDNNEMDIKTYLLNFDTLESFYMLKGAENKEFIEAAPSDMKEVYLDLYEIIASLYNGYDQNENRQFKAKLDKISENQVLDIHRKDFTNIKDLIENYRYYLYLLGNIFDVIIENGYLENPNHLELEKIVEEEDSSEILDIQFIRNTLSSYLNGKLDEKTKKKLYKNVPEAFQMFKN